MNCHGLGGGTNFMVGSSIWNIMIIGLVVFLVFYLFKELTNKRTINVASQQSVNTADSLRILESKFVKGEISSDEFEEKRDLLTRK